MALAAALPVLRYHLPLAYNRTDELTREGREVRSASGPVRSHSLAAAAAPSGSNKAGARTVPP